MRNRGFILLILICQVFLSDCTRMFFSKLFNHKTKSLRRLILYTGPALLVSMAYMDLVIMGPIFRQERHLITVFYGLSGFKRHGDASSILIRKAWHSDWIIVTRRLDEKNSRRKNT